ncbi:ferrochelatase [Corallincola holothuriorum]|uniref:Ferrochelatase n=1 Tax=Corallincola holothuriorum TaxID=2282215 RepID=A0A368NFC3_9GAMM|nr:ferrochelatase [Corallincola holothuriorum]RCU48916.1 ferrochelatase [Corallincola holothuriorum]
MELKHSSGNYGVLLVNLGTPDEPTTPAVRRYLNQFLSDPRVVDVPKWLWQCILKGVILPFRSPRAAKAYSSIWWEEGSPLRVISERQQKALQDALMFAVGHKLPVELAMTYGQPSIPDALERLTAAGVTKIVVLPLFPQYSCSTTAAVFDGIAAALKKQRLLPDLRSVHHYHDHPAFVKAMAGKVSAYWQQNGRGKHLLMSFHGIPQRYADQGDPYAQHCHETATSVAEALGLSATEWTISFQSRVGREQWLTPYTDDTLKAMPAQGIKDLDVICPAFSVDCLETLEEIKEENREYFEHAGGEQYRYIECLNDSPCHIQMMVTLIKEQLVGW